jgi:hypothetical protein
MKSDKARRQVLQGFMALPFAAALVADARRVSAQTGVAVPVKVDTKGLVPKIKFEAELAGFLTELNGRYKLRSPSLRWSWVAMLANTTMLARESGRSHQDP